MKRLFSQNGDAHTIFHYDEMEDTVTLQHIQDCTAIIENNKRLQTMNDGYSPSRFMRRKASIPLGLARQWLQEDGINEVEFWQWKGWAQNEYFRRKYQSSDFRHVRTVS